MWYSILRVDNSLFVFSLMINIGINENFFKKVACAL